MYIHEGDRVTTNGGLLLVNEDASSLGLCANCTHMRRVVSDRGSVFYLCELSKVDPRFEKYPRLPVLSCIGYKKIDD